MLEGLQQNSSTRLSIFVCMSQPVVKSSRFDIVSQNPLSEQQEYCTELHSETVLTWMHPKIIYACVRLNVWAERSGTKAINRHKCTGCKTVVISHVSRGLNETLADWLIFSLYFLQLSVCTVSVDVVVKHWNEQLDYFPSQLLFILIEQIVNMFCCFIPSLYCSCFFLLPFFIAPVFYTLFFQPASWDDLGYVERHL